MTKFTEILICGAPNAGKSTIVNKICGRKISITSPKVQTTRQKTLGVWTDGDTQIAFLDTPGVFRARSGFEMERQITRVAWAEIRSHNRIFLIIDSKRGLCQNTMDIISDLQSREITNVIAVMNKVDLVNTGDKLELAQKIHDFGIFTEIYMISCTSGAGFVKFIEYIKSLAESGEFQYDAIPNIEDPAFFASEITREKIFILLGQELPYITNIVTESFEESSDEILISQVILTPKESHRKIIIGKNGSMIKQIGADAIEELEIAFKKTVRLSLFCSII